MAARAAASPAAVAVVGAEESLTYAQLVRQADTVARHLLRRGVAPGDLVAVCLPRVPAAITALLGVLRAGCGYLPLDPAYPPDRLHFMLEDSGAAAVIAAPQTHILPPVRTIRSVSLTDALLDAGPTPGALPEVRPESLAYVIYTSGSTGRPKGVAVEHRNVAALLQSVAECIAFKPDDIWSWFHSVAFDVSVWEIWTALISGGQVAVVGVHETRDTTAFCELLRMRQVTVLSQTPSAFRRLLPVLEREGSLYSVRTVMLAGEPINIAEFGGILRASPGSHPSIYNLYGITEGTVHSTIKELSTADLDAGVQSPIGIPLPHVRVRVLDGERSPVPVFQHGELWIGGDGVARGYVNRPELTAQRFVTGLQSGSAEMPWYRTGDVVRQLPTGELDYIGRMDRQVKLRGFRIELGEIETVLQGHPSISAATVDVREEEATAADRLAARLVLTSGADLTVEEIRAWLMARVPAYMVPASFATVGNLPMTPNGKVDREALNHLIETPLRRGENAQPPETSMEKRIKPLWSDTLGIEDIGRRDNFFALGGDSMSALRLAGACKAVGIPAVVQVLYENPTLAEFSAALASAQPWSPRDEAEDGEGTSPPASDSVEVYIPATHMQSGVLFESEFRRDVGAYQVVSALRLTGLPEIGRDKVLRALKQIARDNAALRTSFDLAGFSKPMQVVHRESPVDFHYEDVSHMAADAQRQRVAEVFAQECGRHYRFSDYPLWRLSVLRSGPESVHVILGRHHAILDGWSTARFFDQLLAVLSGTGWQAAPISVNERAAALEAAAVSSPQSADFWRGLAKSWSPMPLQLRDPGEDDPVLFAAQAPVDAGMRDELRQVAGRWMCSPKHVHLAAHLRSIADLAQWRDYAATCLNVNARPEEPRAENALGLFVNAVPFVVQGLGASWRELARTVMNLEVRLQPHRWFPLAAMMSGLGLRTPTVAFNYTDFSATAMRGFLRSVTEMTVTESPLTVSVVDDGVVVQGMSAHFSDTECALLAESHVERVRDAIAEGLGRR